MNVAWNRITRRSFSFVLAALFVAGIYSAASSAEVKPGPKDDDAPEEFTETKSGLKYRILRKSDGAKPKATDSVTVHYKGWLDNGKEFDSSYKRGEEISFPLDMVIPGWTEGLQLVAEGGIRRTAFSIL